MKKITWRNMLGGFLGGTLGILMFAHYHWAGLGIGCVLGFVIGCYHLELVNLLAFVFTFTGGATAMQKIERRHAEVRTIAVRRLLRRSWARKVSRLKESAAPKARHYGAITAATAIWALFWFTLNRVLVHVGWIDGALLDSRGENFIGTHKIADACFWISVLLCLGAMLLVLRDFEWADSLKWQKGGRAVRESKGAVGFFASSTLFIFVNELSAFYFLLCVLVMFVAALLATVVLFPFWAIHKLFKEQVHIPSLCITCMTTAVSAWSLHHWILEPRTRWVVALLTGCVSGLLSGGFGYIAVKKGWLEENPKEIFKNIVEEGLGLSIVDGMNDRLEALFTRVTGITV